MKDERQKYKELVERKEQAEEAPRTFAEFTGIMDEILEKIDKVQSTTALHRLINPIFLNFSTDKKNVVNYTLKQPFDRLESENISQCGHEG